MAFHPNIYTIVVHIEHEPKKIFFSVLQPSSLFFFIISLYKWWLVGKLVTKTKFWFVVAVIIIEGHETKIKPKNKNTELVVSC